MGKEKLGIYIHVPYCVRKCNYCDFFSQTFSRAERSPAEYFRCLVSDIETAGTIWRGRFEVDSVFFGGGTPSAVEPELLCGALDELGHAFHLTEDAEISLEANPGTISRKSLEAYRAAGFNRISVGVQSLDDGVLRIMGRIHSADEGLEALKLAKSVFPSVNADLMIGTPGQTLDIWLEGLKRVLNEEPQHLSFYSLQLEEGTPFYEEYRTGKLELPAWEENREMYHRGLELIKSAGYRHYEISNAAKPGYECCHNLKYWTMRPYLGLGRTAHSFIDGVRFAEKPAPGPEDAAEDRDSLRGDFIFTQLRLIEGLDEGFYEELFGSSFISDFASPLWELFAQDLLFRPSPGRVAFTEKGLDLTNPVMQRLLEEL